jgi:hypothetical protein
MGGRFSTRPPILPARSRDPECRAETAASQNALVESSVGLGATKAVVLTVLVEYDPEITDPDVIASYLDLVLDAAHSALDQCGPLTFGEVVPLPDQTEPKTKTP